MPSKTKAIRRRQRINRVKASFTNVLNGLLRPAPRKKKASRKKKSGCKY